MNNRPEQIRIAVTGPESTGKTTIAKRLAEMYNGLYIPEYARDYVEKLNHHYTFEDVEAIAQMQVMQYKQAYESDARFVFFDTWLIITKVWFEWVYQRVPDWLEDEIQKCRIDLFLLCRPDLPWEADTVRENGGENRIKLYNRYKSYLDEYGFRYVEIEGIGEARIAKAVEMLRLNFE